MKNVTLSADERLIERARDTARANKTTLNAEFRKWLENYSGRARAVEEFDRLMKRMSYVKTGGRRFRRDELNERR